ANAYAQTLNSIFTEQQKPYEVELCVAEVGDASTDDRLYRLTYDGSIGEEPEYVVLGGQTEPIVSALKGSFRAGQPLAEALGVAVRALASVGADNGKPRELPAGQLEVAVLDRTRPSRKFRRVVGAALTGLLPGATPAAAGSDTPPGTAPGTEVPGATGEPPGPDADAPPGTDKPEGSGPTG
ncbi:MAG TPA: proteasome subunit alpha, partial [Mycobacteriales bacterium]|nr:proteasome subunit alpha [Mycobacteriales bacterium]